MKSRILFSLIIAGVTVLTTSASWGQIVPLLTDTLQIVNDTVAPGDTGVRVSIALRNTIAVGGFGVRFLYDSTVFTPRTVSGSLVFEETPRTDTLPKFIIGGSIPQPAVLTFSEVIDVQQRPCSTCAVFHIPPGTGPVVRFIFDVSPTAPAGTYNLTFQDDPQSPGSFNKLSDTTGLQLYEPRLANGVITVTGGITPQNDPPLIVSIPNQSVVEGETLSFNVTASDPDGDNVTLQALSLPPNAAFPTVVGDSVVTGIFTFVPSLTQGPDTIGVTFRATDDSAKSAQRTVTIEIIDRPEDILVIDSTSGGIPGKTGVLVPIVLNSIQDIFGLQFDLKYNDSLITIDSFIPDTLRMANFDIYTNLGDSAGFLTLVAFSLSADSIPPGNGPIMYMAVTIDTAAKPGRTLLDLKNGRESISRNPLDPSVALRTVSGNFTIDPFGDLNLDLLVDVQDAVIMVGYLLGNISLNQRRLDVADVNRDSSIDVGDLVGIINLILGRPIGSPIFYAAGLAKVELVYGQFEPGALEDVQLSADFQIPVAGVQVVIDYDPNQIRFTELNKTFRSNQMTLTQRDDNQGRLKLLLYRGSGEPINIGAGSILSLRAAVNSNLSPDEKIYLKISKLVLADTAAVVIPTGEGPILPTDFKLEQNFPNPFNSSTTIRFEVPFNQGGATVQTTLKVYNILGQKVRVLLDQPRLPGIYQVTWDGRDDSGDAVASGLYFYRLTVGKNSESKKMTLLK